MNPIFLSCHPAFEHESLINILNSLLDFNVERIFRKTVLPIEIRYRTAVLKREKISTGHFLFWWYLSCQQYSKPRLTSYFSFCWIIEIDQIFKCVNLLVNLVSGDFIWYLLCFCAKTSFLIIYVWTNFVCDKKLWKAKKTDGITLLLFSSRLLVIRLPWAESGFSTIGWSRHMAIRTQVSTITAKGTK